MDLEELAKQYGGVSTKVEPVNLEKLAKELGGTSRPVKALTAQKPLPTLRLSLLQALVS
jgi:hypothetical protein